LRVKENAINRVTVSVSLPVLASSSLCIFFFLQYWGLNSGPTHQATLPVLFCDSLFLR
jgi:hypothetical protein